MLGAFFPSKHVTFDNSVWVCTKCGTLLIKLKIVENLQHIHTRIDAHKYIIIMQFKCHSTSELKYFEYCSIFLYT